MTATSNAPKAGAGTGAKSSAPAGNRERALQARRDAKIKYQGDESEGKPGAHHHKPAKHKRSKHHKHRRRHHPAASVPAVLGLPGAPQPPAIPVNPPPPSSTPPPAQSTPITLAQARRLLWRAGFGPTPGQARGACRPAPGAGRYSPHPARRRGRAARVPRRPMKKATRSNPPTSGAQDHCWWLDRMVRSDQQLVERMTFIWHDWFANSNEKVNSQQRMLDQNELFREHALGNFHDLFLAVTANPAMLVFLDGIYNDKHDPNENYAREMMELFSLGADRGAYTEDDVSEMARALTGWHCRMDRKQRPAELPLRSRAPRHRHQDRVRADRELELGRRRAPVRQPPAARLVLRQQAVELLRPDAAGGSDAGLAAGPVRRARGYSIRAVVEAILQHPDFLEGPELVTPPVVYNAGLLRAIGRGIDTTAWAWLSSAAGQQLFYPPNVSGWDFTRWLDTSTAKARWEIASYVTAKSYPNPWPAERRTGIQRNRDRPRSAGERAWPTGASPRSSAESQQCIAAFAESCLSRRRHRQMAAQPLPGDPPERAADADRDLPRHAGELTMAKSCSCNDFTRSQLLRAGIAAGRQRPAEDRAGYAAAGRHRAGPALVPAALGRRGAVGVRRLGARRRVTSKRASRRRPPPPAQPAGARVDLHGRRLGRAVGARAGQGSPLPRTAPRARPQRRRRRAVQRGRTPDVAPAGRRALPQLHAEGKVTVFPAIGYDPPDESHFTSRHYWEVGELNADSAHRLDGPLPRHRRRTRQPPARPFAGLLARPGAGDREGAGGGRLLALGLQLLGLWPGRTADGAHARDVRPPGRARRALARLRAGARRIAGHRHHPRTRSRRSTKTKANRASPRPSPIPPAAATSPRAWRCSPRCSTTKRCRSNACR